MVSIFAIDDWSTREVKRKSIEHAPANCDVLHETSDGYILNEKTRRDLFDIAKPGDPDYFDWSKKRRREKFLLSEEILAVIGIFGFSLVMLVLAGIFKG